ncbi:MAG: hypothetical protein ACXVYB_00960 [Arthrobacter sp.]
MANAYPRESVEFMPVQVTLDGAAVTTDVSFAIVPDGHRPVTFTPATILLGVPGVMLGGLAAGTYRVYARIASGPETPVIDCGYFYVE